jgi:hypothetical protein
MAQKVIDVVGTSKESFAKAAENAVAEAAKTVRGMKWAGSGTRNGIGWQKDSQIPNYNEDLFRHRKVGIVRRGMESTQTKATPRLLESWGAPSFDQPSPEVCSQPPYVLF